MLFQTVLTEFLVNVLCVLFLFLAYDYSFWYFQAFQTQKRRLKYKSFRKITTETTMDTKSLHDSLGHVNWKGEGYDPFNWSNPASCLGLSEAKT